MSPFVSIITIFNLNRFCAADAIIPIAADSLDSVNLNAEQHFTGY